MEKAIDLSQFKISHFNSSKQIPAEHIIAINGLKHLEIKALSDKRGADVMLDSISHFSEHFQQFLTLTLESELIGFVEFTIVDCTIKILYIVIDRSYRRRTLGSFLYNRLVEIGETIVLNTGVTTGSDIRIDAFALPGDRGAKSFFESVKAKGNLIVMSKYLPRTES